MLRRKPQKKRVHAAVRITLQLLLAGPIIVYAPWAVLVGPVSLALLFSGEAQGVAKTLAFSLGWIGLVGLYGSVLVPLRLVHGTVWIRRALTVALACGFITVIAMLFEDGDPVDFIRKVGLFGSWLLGGPVAVAIWNLLRYYRPAPSSVGDRV